MRWAESTIEATAAGWKACEEMSSLLVGYGRGSLLATRRPMVVLAIGLGAMLGIFFARLTIADGPESGVTFLLALPIALIARELGRTAGLAAAVLAVGYVVLWTQLRDVDLGALAYVSRGAIFVLVAFLGAQIGRPGAHAPAAVPAAAPRSPLTPREREVLGLLASGHTNKQVAERLVVSVRTVEAHRANIQAKLGCSGRAELYRRAAELDLLPPSA